MIHVTYVESVKLMSVLVRDHTNTYVSVYGDLLDMLALFFLFLFFILYVGRRKPMNVNGEERRKILSFQIFFLYFAFFSGSSVVFL